MTQARRSPDQPLRRPHLFAGVVDGVRRLLAAEPEGGVPREDGHLGRSLAEVAPPSAGPDVAAGRFSLIGLAQIRQKLGPRWPQLAQKVHAVAETVINRHLLKGDVFERCSDDSYLVLFARLDKAQADFKCRVISKEIARHLLGTEWEVLAGLETIRADVSREALATGNVEDVLERALAMGTRTTISPAEAEAQASAAEPAAELLFLHRSEEPSETVERPQEAGAPKRSLSRGGDDMRVPDARRPDAADQESACDDPEAAAPRGRSSGPEERTPAWRPIRHRPEPGPEASTALEAQEPPPELPRVATPADPDAGPPAVGEPVVWRYSPIWDYQQSALIRFRLSACVNGRTVHPYSGKDPDASETALFENDLRAVSKVLRDLALLASRGRRLPVVCPVHFSSVSLESRRSRLFHELRNGPPHSSRLVVLEVVRPPGALWARGFLDIADAFRRSGFTASMCLPVDRLAEVAALAPHVQALTTETPGGGAIEKVKIEQLNAFVRRTRGAGIDAGVYGLSTRSLVMAALGGGFRFLSGEAVHASAETLENALRFEALDLYVKR